MPTRCAGWVAATDRAGALVSDGFAEDDLRVVRLRRPASKVSLGALAMALALSSSPSAAQPIEDGVFVEVRGDGLALDGAPFAFLGANVAVTHSRPHRDALEVTLDAARADGLSVIRVWAFGEAPADAPAWRRDYALRLGPEGWIEASFAHLDRVLVEARRRDLRVVLVLANRWADFGGFPELARWAGRPPSGRDLSSAELEAFYACAPCRAHYAASVARVVGRTNGETGVAYRDDPTILAWELANEIGSASAEGGRAIVDWVDTHARLVRSLGARQLVIAGHIGWRLERERAAWRRVVALPSVDVASLHAYPRRDPRLRSPRDLAAWIDLRAEDAASVSKPLLVGEVGFPLTRGGLVSRAGASEGARWLDAFLARCARRGVAGVSIWNYRVSGYPDPYAIHPDVGGHAVAVRRVLRRRAASWPARRVAPSDAAADDATASVGRARRAPDVLGLARVRGAAWRAEAGLPRALGVPRIERAGPRAHVVVPVPSFHDARFEAVGVHLPADEPEAGFEALVASGLAVPPGLVAANSAHLWGAGEGWVEFRLPALGTITGAGLRRVSVTLRASSELPGLGGGGPGDESRVRVSLGGVSLGERAMIPDDGAGRRERWVLEEASRLAAIPASRPLLLRVEALAEDDGGRGLALYASEPIVVTFER